MRGWLTQGAREAPCLLTQALTLLSPGATKSILNIHRPKEVPDVWLWLSGHVSPWMGHLKRCRAVEQKDDGRACPASPTVNLGRSILKLQRAPDTQTQEVLCLCRRQPAETTASSNAGLLARGRGRESSTGLCTHILNSSWDSRNKFDSLGGGTGFSVLFSPINQVR